jgi:hypothetical protein
MLLIKISLAPLHRREDIGDPRSKETYGVHLDNINGRRNDGRKLRTLDLNLKYSEEHKDIPGRQKLDSNELEDFNRRNPDFQLTLSSSMRDTKLVGPGQRKSQDDVRSQSDAHQDQPRG